MEQYISKAALVAEIEKRRRDWSYGSSIEAKYKREECDDILSLLDTLEVKEVNLSKELADVIDGLSKCYPEISFAKLSRIAVRIAKWQKEQDIV